MDSDFTSPPTIIQRLPGISYQILWTGNPVGSFDVEVSNTYKQGPDGVALVDGTWETLPSAALIGTLPAPMGTDGSGIIDVVGTEVYAIRVKYTYTSGTGSAVITPCAKVL